ncbi:MAG: nucleoside monophosphate kinase [Candidatus Aenigmarchaeota archaeon]|nr:nucleoside monophosphate kinase [Candidatus Aenigmarchaeota archaeon]MDW8159842.1 nucleoside monophosphate kinase [Candidatus Aenigmarchaeota archaeon]
MKLIIFGPPGSGKGTYSSKLKEKFGLEKISTGDIFREEIKKGSELGKKVEKYLREGKLVPDDIVIEVVIEKIKNLEKFILDGFPRTVDQAKALDSMVNIDAIIKINAHPEILVEKISARRICSNPKCDGNYNVADIRKVIDGVEYILPPLLPKNDMKCDKCGSPLIQRDDDKPSVIMDRLKVYEEQTKPVIDYYLKKKKPPFIEIWMSRPPEQVVEKIVEGLRKLNLVK